MTEYARLVIAVDSTQVGRADAELKKLGQTTVAVERQSTALTSAVSSLAPALATVSAALSVRQLAGYADTWSDLTSRVRLSIGAHESASVVMQRLSDIARGTYSSMEMTAESFAQNSVTLRALGKSTSEQLDYTEALNNALVVSGAKADRAQMVQNSLSKAMAEGALRGEELNNVLNSGSRVAELLAEEFGVNITQLRALGADGKITGDIIYNSLVKNMEALKDEAESMPATIADGFLLLRNSVLQSVGVFDQANGLSGELAESLVTVSDAIRDTDWTPYIGAVATAAKIAGAYLVAVNAIPLAKAAAAVATTSYHAVLAAFSGQVAITTAQLLTMRTALNTLAAGFAGWQIGTYLRNEFEIVEKAGIALMGGLHTMAIQVGGYFERLGASISFALTNPLDAFRNKLADLLQSLSGLGQRGLRMLGLDDFADAIGNGIEKIRSQTGEEHRAMLEQMRKDTQREADAVSEIYAQMFADVGKSAGANLNVVSKGLDDVLDRLGGFNDELEETGGNTGGITKVDTAFQSLYDSLFPAEAAQRKYNEQVALLKKHLQGDALAKAIDRLNDSLADGDHTGPADAIAAYVEELQNLEDKINPAGRAMREFQEEQAKLRAEIERSGDPTGKWTRLLEENERQMRENTRVTNQWTEWTESALERVDSAFADAWRNIGDGFGSFRDNLVNAFKQMLAELAHLAITRPIVLQIGAAMGIGGAAAQLSSMGGGGGFDLIGMLGRGVSLSQSGFGQAVISGWKSGEGVLGGLQGAFSSGSSYVSGLFGGGAATGAGTGYGLGQPLVAGELGAASYAAPAMQTWGGAATSLGAILGGLGGAYMGWQQNGLKGAVGTGLASWGGGALGGMGGAALGQAIGGTIGSVLPGIGTAIGVALGGMLGGSLFGGSGERFKRTVGSATGSYSDGQYTSGGQSQTWFAGYHRTFGDEFNQSLDDLNRQFSSVLGGLFDAFDIDSTIETEARARQRRTSGRLAADFLVTIDGEMAEHLRQYGGKGDVGKAMEEFADDIMGEYLAKTIVNSALPEYLRDQFRGLTEADQVAETLAGVIARFDGVNSALELVGLTSLSTTDAGLRAADAIVALSGGIESLTGSVSVYYDQFFTAAEKQADTISAVEKAFEAANITLAESREGYRAMVEDIDVTTEAGQQMFATMMSLSGMAAEYYSILEQRAAEATSRLLANTSLYYEQFTSESQKTEDALAGVVAQFAELELALPSTRAGFIAAVDALDTSTEAGQRMFETLMSVAGAADAYYDVLEQRASQAVTAAYSLLERSINAEKAALTEAYQQRKAQYEAELQARRQSQQQAAQARSASYRDMAQTAAATASALSRLGGSISSALSGLLDDVPGMLEQRRSSAVAQIRRALETGSLSDADALAEAAQRAAAVDTGVFSTLEDYRREQGRTANLLSELGDLTATRQTAAEQQAASLQALADQSAATAQALGQSISGVKSSIDIAYEAEMAALDEQLELAKSQIDALNGIDNSVVSVAEAVDGLSAAITSLMQIVPGMSGVEVPGFASGGLHSGGLRLVGERGPELEVTGPARIYSAGQTAQMLGGGAETAAAINRLEQTVARQGDALRAIAKHTMKSARNTEVLERWDYDGLPEERALA